MKRNGMTNQQRTERQFEALSRAKYGQALTNYPEIFRAFSERGIPADEIKPRENVFSYHAWRALGRQVKKGEHGVCCLTFITCSSKPDEDGKTDSYRRPHKVYVFHVSQTEPLGVSEPSSTGASLLDMLGAA